MFSGENSEGFLSLYFHMARVMDDIARVFNLASLGIDVPTWADKMRPTFLRLPWDSYELRGRQLAALRAASNVEHKIVSTPSANTVGEGESAFAPKDFLNGVCELEALPAFCALEPQVQQRLRAMERRRKRAVATFFISEEGPVDGQTAGQHRHAAPSKWRVERCASGQFVQYNSPFYPDQRQFDEMEEEVVQDSNFQKILHFLPQLVREAGESVSELKVVCHQVALCATPNTPGHGSPEGIHQDGADFIVSALVLHRENIEGGMSRVYRKKEDGSYTLCFTHTLQAGEGLFQADENTAIWHDVTPVTVADNTSTGLRTTFGFDIHVLKGAGN